MLTLIDSQGEGSIQLLGYIVSTGSLTQIIFFSCSKIVLLAITTNTFFKVEFIVVCAEDIVVANPI